MVLLPRIAGGGLGRRDGKRKRASMDPELYHRQLGIARELNMHSVTIGWWCGRDQGGMRTGTDVRLEGHREGRLKRVEVSQQSWCQGR